MAIPFNDNLHVAAPKPVDKRYLNANNLPYASTSQVLSTIPSYERYVGLTVLVTGGTEYWFQNDVTNLVEKASGSGTGTTVNITANNGLRKIGNNIVLGGPLTGNTNINISNKNLVISATTGGLKYAGDYSANYDDHSLVDKSWVLSQIPTGSTGTITGATNGLSLLGGGKQIGLGGVLTGDTYISSFDQNQNLFIGSPNQLNYFQVTAAQSVSFDVNGNTSQMALGIGDGVIQTYDTGVPVARVGASLTDARAYINKNNSESTISATEGKTTLLAKNNNIGGQDVQLQLAAAGTTGATVSSTLDGFKGLEYDRDYSASFGPRSIPDVGYINSNSKIYFETLTAETATLKSQRDVFAQVDFINTVNDYFLNNYGILGDNLPDNDVTFIILDPTQTILTFGTLGGGLYIIDLNLFTSTVYNPSNSGSTYTGSAIPANINKGLWIGDDLYYTSNDILGFGKFNYTSLVNTRYTSTSSNYSGDTIQNFACTNIALDENTNDDVYFVVASHGLARYTISTGRHLKYDVSGSNYSGDILQQLTRDVVYSNFQMWITTQTGGLYSFDPSFDFMTKFSTTSGNYSGDVFPSNAFSNIVTLNGILYFSGNRFDTSAIENRRLVKGVTYSGDTLSNLTYVSSDGIHIYSMTADGYGKFNTLTNHNVNANGVDGYLNTFTSSIFLFNDAAGLIFDPSYALLGKSSSSNGVGIIGSSPSPFQLRFDEHGLKYTSDQSAYFGDRSVVDKGFVNQQIANSAAGLTSQINAVQGDVDDINDILAPYERPARPATTTLGQLYYFDFLQAGNTYLTTTGGFLHSGGVLQLFSGTGSFTQYATIDQFNQPGYTGDSQNCFEFWKIKAKFKITSAVGGTTYAFSLGMRSTNGYSKIDQVCRLSAESSDFYFYSLLNGSPSQQRPSSGYTTIVQNSTYYFEVERVKNRLWGRLYNASNVLQGESHYDYNITTTGSSFWSNNVGVPVIYNHGGSISIMDLEITSNHKKNVDLVAVSDSNGHGLYVYSGQNRARYIEQAANSLGMSFNNFSGVDAGIRDADKLKRTIKFSNPRFIYLNDFSNDIANSTGFTTQYNSLVTYLKQNIPYVRIIHGSPIARNYSTDAAYTTFSPYTASGDTLVDGFQATKFYTTNQLNPALDSFDHIHLNEYGHNAMAERLMMALLKEGSKTILYT